MEPKKVEQEVLHQIVIGGATLQMRLLGNKLLGAILISEGREIGELTPGDLRKFSSHVREFLYHADRPAFNRGGAAVFCNSYEEYPPK